MNQATTFNNDELLHLALHAAENDTPEKTLSYLKQLINQDPQHSQGWYLMGAMHAEIGMYTLAIEEISKALQLNPDLPTTAPFQLGLLLVTSGEIERGKQVWEILDTNGESDPLYLFKMGLSALIDDQFEAAKDILMQGIELNTTNIALNNDMQRIVENIQQIDSNDDDIDNTPEGQKMLLSIYDNEH
jgi:tetratricopeptide (TPR) repeat protein